MTISYRELAKVYGEVAIMRGLAAWFRTRGDDPNFMDYSSCSMSTTMARRLAMSHVNADATCSEPVYKCIMNRLPPLLRENQHGNS